MEEGTPRFARSDDVIGFISRRRVKTHPTKLRNVIVFLALAFQAAGAARAGAQEQEGEPFRIGQYLQVIEGLAEPCGVAIGANERIYIADSGHHRIGVYDAAGQELARLGRFGHGEGELMRPRGVALGPAGEVFVADTGNHRVVVFGADGAFARSWGSRGRAAGELCAPEGIAVDGEHVYVADTGNERVQVFDQRGEFVREIGAGAGGVRESAAGALRRPVDAAIGPEGTVLVADLDESRVVQFDADGQVVRTWGEWGSFRGMLGGPLGVALFDGTVYVADTGNHRVQIFSGASKDVLYEWGRHVLRPHEGDGRIHYPSRLAIAPSGRFAVVTEGFEDRAQIYARRTAEYVEDEWRPSTPEEGTLNHYGPWLDADGEYLVISEPDTHSVLVHDATQSTPIMISQVGGTGRSLGQFVRPGDVAVDRERGRVYAVDRGNRRLQVLSLRREAGEPIRYMPGLCKVVKSVDLPALGKTFARARLEWALQIDALDVDAKGRLYALDVRNARVVVMGADFSLVEAWGEYGAGEGEMLEPVDLAVDTRGETVYVADAGAARVCAYSREGALRRCWGRRGAGEGEFVRPAGVAVGSDGSVYVTDARTHCVQRFDAEGKFIARWGARGIGAGEFFKPCGIVADGERVIVIDYGNHRGQYFSVSGWFQQAFGSRWYVQPASRAGRGSDEVTK